MKSLSLILAILTVFQPFVRGLLGTGTSNFLGPMLIVSSTCSLFVNGKIEKTNPSSTSSTSSPSSTPLAYNVIFRRDVGIAAIHKFVSELKKRSLSNEHPNFHVTVDKVLTNMKLIKIVNPSPEAWKFITTQKSVKEYYETPVESGNDL
jgi:hypothetical protein